MSKVIICVGISGSGKSTWSKEYVKDFPSYIRINRDDIRFMIKNLPVLKQKDESYVSSIQSTMINQAIMANFNIIIDNTNLKKEIIDDILELVKYKADVYFHLFPINLQVAIERDLTRERTVGYKVIERQFDEYQKLINETPPEFFDIHLKQTQIYTNPLSFSTSYHPNFKEQCAIFDIDGSLAHMNGKRGPYDFENVNLDDLDMVLREHVLFHKSKNRKIIILSGRDDSCYELTEQWLNDNNIPFDNLFMRNTGDQRKDFVIKEDIYNTHIKDNYEVIVIYDDRESVVDHWRKLGLRCYQVKESKF